MYKSHTGDMAKQDAGITSLCRAHQGAHYCLLYKSEDDLVDLLSHYFQYGIENNEYCIWVTANSVVEKKARQALFNAVPGIAKKKDQIEFARAREWYLKGGSFQSERVCKSWYEKLDYSIGRGYKGIRVTGDVGWYDETAWSNVMDYEMHLNDVIPHEKFVVICSYPLERLSASQLIEIAHHHQRTIVKNNGKWQIFEAFESGKTTDLVSSTTSTIAAKIQTGTVGNLPSLYPDKCNGCGLCISVCQQGLLYLQNEKIAVQNTGSCDWCTYCEAVCTTNAIVCEFEIILPG
jgi:ferredoxin